MQIKLLINNTAKKTIKNMIRRVNDTTPIDSLTYILIKAWLNERNNVKCFILYENEIIKSFALLHKCDYDSLNTHNNPYVLDIIYTFIPYRRNKLAYKLLLHMKNANNITAFCNNDASFMLFQKAEYVLIEGGFIGPALMFRYP